VSQENIFVRKTQVPGLELGLLSNFSVRLPNNPQQLRLSLVSTHRTPAKITAGDYQHMLASQSIEILGAVAGFCTTFAFVPQLLKIRKQGGRDLSYGMLAFYLAGVLLWLAYGILLRAPSVILANSATSFLIVLAIILKAFKERRAPSPNLVAEQFPGRS
jgi:MtN3 and saliva related transmembrane protein